MVAMGVANGLSIKTYGLHKILVKFHPTSTVFTTNENKQIVRCLQLDLSCQFHFQSDKTPPYMPNNQTSTVWPQRRTVSGDIQ